MFVLLPTRVQQPHSGSAAPWANCCLVAFTIVAFVCGWSSSWYIWPDSGRWSILTYGFAHGSPWHLIVNMIVLAVIGNPVNRRLGNGWYLLTYFGTMLALGCLGRWLGIGPVGGASGAIFAVVTVFLLLMPAAHVRLAYAAAFPITLLVGLIKPPAEGLMWFIRWGSLSVRAWWCILLIPVMEAVSFVSWRITLGIWPWTHPAHLLGMVCGLGVVLLLPERISMPAKG